MLVKAPGELFSCKENRTCHGTHNKFLRVGQVAMVILQGFFKMLDYR